MVRSFPPAHGERLRVELTKAGPCLSRRCVFWLRFLAVHGYRHVEPSYDEDERERDPVAVLVRQDRVRFVVPTYDCFWNFTRYHLAVGDGLHVLLGGRVIHGVDKRSRLNMEGAHRTRGEGGGRSTSRVG